MYIYRTFRLEPSRNGNKGKKESKQSTHEHTK